MQIGIIGAGNIGSALASRSVQVGHQIALYAPHNRQPIEQLIQEWGQAIRALPLDDTIAFGELVVLALPFEAAFARGSRGWGERIVVDATNYFEQRDGPFPAEGRTSSEALAEHLSIRRLVKAFNTLWSETLRTGGQSQLSATERLVLLLAGDDPQAKADVASLVQELGFTPLDTGSLREGGRWQEPDSPLYNLSLHLADAQAMLAQIKEGKDE